ncbi:PD-(D/E)XK motif protein [Caproicibacter sp.]|uniref:PD-(D/E)XK motif protein n=1 Tax=Caproicibacter sp. TaxID=2814884 RepID=UPI003989A46B
MNTQLLNNLKLIPTTESIYLLEKLTESSGFFGTQKKLLYAAKNVQQLEHNSVDTEFLSIKTHVYISAIENTSQFSTGYYNIIQFKGSIEDKNIEAFIRLCRIYSTHSEELSFWDFFYSLSSLFQPSQEQHFKNLVGLWGELTFMKKIYNSLNRDLSSDWHRNGTYSKYDFISDKANIEVKTVVNDLPIVKIKHLQVFNEETNFLVAICIENNSHGESIIDLVEYLRSIPKYFNSLSFNINIERELQRISPVEAKETKFKLISCSLYNSKDLNVFTDIPYTISDLQYVYNLCDAAPINIATEQNQLW